VLSYAVAVTHNSPRQAPSAATHKSNPVTRLFAPRKSKFLIANPRLEFAPTHTKQTPLIFSNREYNALFQIVPSRRESKNRSRPLTHVTPGLLTRNAGVPPAFLTFAFPAAPSYPERHRVSRLALLTHGRAFRTAGLSRGTRGIPAGSFAFSWLITRHSSPVTAFLTYGSAIRNPRNSQKT
jgi:hypothetical protein